MEKDMHRKIISITLNPSIDVTLWLDGLHLDKANRVERETREMGGKGINVSHTVHSFGLDTLCLTVAGEENSREFASYLERDGLRYELLQTEGAVRENLTLRSEGQTVKINRKGPSMSAMMFGALMALIKKHIRPGDIAVFGGSLPENISVQDYMELILAVKNAGALIALDSDSLRLDDYRNIAPWLIKPNIHELKNIVEIKGTTITDIVDAARVLKENGIENVLVSLGGNGIACLSGSSVIHAAVPTVDVKSTVGAGDSALAGFIVGYVKDYPLEECVRLAAACGTATAMKDGTALATKESAAALLEQIKIKNIN
jgi:1-phosphofructokinase family hexose kinase